MQQNLKEERRTPCAQKYWHERQLISDRTKMSYGLSYLCLIAIPKGIILYMSSILR